jgi:hypothetical protein
MNIFWQKNGYGIVVYIVFLNDTLCQLLCVDFKILKSECSVSFSYGQFFRTFQKRSSLKIFKRINLHHKPLRTSPIWN